MDYGNNTAKRVVLLQDHVAWSLTGDDLTADSPAKASSKVTDINNFLNLTNALLDNLVPINS